MQLRGRGRNTVGGRRTLVGQLPGDLGGHQLCQGPQRVLRDAGVVAADAHLGQHRGRPVLPGLKDGHEPGGRLGPHPDRRPEHYCG